MTQAEEFALVNSAVDASENGFSIAEMVLKQYALLIAVAKHGDSEITWRWEKCGVSHEWVKGFQN